MGYVSHAHRQAEPWVAAKVAGDLEPSLADGIPTLSAVVGTLDAPGGRVAVAGYTTGYTTGQTTFTGRVWYRGGGQNQGRLSSVASW
jgi:hypothetical protein